MQNTPSQPDVLPPEGSVDAETASHAEHGIPHPAKDDVPTGLPTSDRHHGEVAPAKT